MTTRKELVEALRLRYRSARLGTALRGNDPLRQAILTLALRVGIDAS